MSALMTDSWNKFEVSCSMCIAMLDVAFVSGVNCGHKRTHMVSKNTPASQQKYLHPHGHKAD